MALGPAKPRIGACARKNTRRQALRGRPCRRYAAIAAPTSAGTGSAARAPRFPRTVTCPPSQFEIVQLEKRHFARPQSQTREQQQDRVIATSPGGLPIDGGQQLTDRCCRNRTWDRWHRPIGDGGNGGHQILCDVSPIADIVQEGPQGGGQLLRAFDVQPRGPPLDEAHDIAGTQAGERDAAPAESIGQELATNVT